MLLATFRNSIFISKLITLNLWVRNLCGLRRPRLQSGRVRLPFCWRFEMIHDRGDDGYGDYTAILRCREATCCWREVYKCLDFFSSLVFFSSSSHTFLPHPPKLNVHIHMACLSPETQSQNGHGGLCVSVCVSSKTTLGPIRASFPHGSYHFEMSYAKNHGKADHT